jgi:MFS family permease
MCGFFTSIAPAMMGNVLGYDNRLLVGVVAGSIFIASTLGQFLQDKLPLRRRLPIGCATLVAGVTPVALGIYSQSLTLFIAGAIIAGMGQGIAFRAGLGAINAACPAAERAAVTSTFFIIAYIAISVPVIGIGLMASLLSLKATGIIFSVFVGAMAAVALLIILWRDCRTN